MTVALRENTSSKAAREADEQIRPTLALSG